MAIRTVVTQGFGAGATIALVCTDGFAIAAAPTAPTIDIDMIVFITTAMTHTPQLTTAMSATPQITTGISLTAEIENA